MRILIVDDSRPFLLALEAILADVGFGEVVSAESAEEAFRILESTAIDLILIDLVMPEVDGIEALRRLKSSENLREIPVLMISGQDDENRIEEAFLAGAIDFIGKPPKRLELRARVRSALKLKREMDHRRRYERDLEILNRSLEEANRELRRLSTIDPLTGLANRRQFRESYLGEWARAQREGRPLSVVMLDIDFFKKFNDRYGHLAGDDCLERIAGALAGALHRGGDLLARYGGEEFIAVLPGIDADGAAEVAESMRRQVLAQGIEHDRSAIHEFVTVSAGAATLIPGPAIDPSVLIEAADRALYLAKSRGRNRVEVERSTAFLDRAAEA
jgi:diguanylate cyclase (GGDEF)-like protein